MTRAARRLLLAASLSACALSGCFLFHDDYPDDSCRTSADCFRAQGEVCNPETRRCEVVPDAGPATD